MVKGTVLAQSLATHSALRQGSQTGTSLRVCASLSLLIHIYFLTLFPKLVTHCSVIMMK